jgi:hypothetical protein
MQIQWGGGAIPTRFLLSAKYIPRLPCGENFADE